MGLDSNASTVASFLRFYTPGIVGGSLGHHFAEVCDTVNVWPLKILRRDHLTQAAMLCQILAKVVHAICYSTSATCSRVLLDCGSLF